MKSFIEYLDETIGTNGLEYEMKVFKALNAAGISDLNVGSKPGAGFSNVGAGDIEASYKGKPFNIEIKLSNKDQMGGGSFRYDIKTQAFTPAKAMDPEDLIILTNAAKEKIKDINNYIKAARKLEPVEYHKNISGIPIKVSKDGRDILQKSGLLAKINKSIKHDISFIVKHYNKKGVYYINIGGSGLFYLGSNPLKLDIPPLKGAINIEMRLGYSGSKVSFKTDPPIPARTGGLRLQGRLITKGKSPYSLDNVDDIKKLFGEK